MSADTDTLRTTALRLPPERLGEVWLYRVSEAFQERWQAIGGEYRRRRTRDSSDPRRLPYGTLAAALRIHSGGFVRLEPGDLPKARV